MSGFDSCVKECRKLSEICYEKQKEIDSLKELVKQLIKVNEFYGNKKSWYTVNNHDFFAIDKDREYGLFGLTASGGKRAREVAKSELYQEILRGMDE